MKAIYACVLTPHTRGGRVAGRRRPMATFDAGGVGDSRRVELAQRFVVDEGALNEQFEQLVLKVASHCLVDRGGKITIKNGKKLSTRDRIKLILAARLIAARLDPAIGSEVSVSMLSEFA